MKQKILGAAVNVICAIAIVFSLVVGWTAITTRPGKAPVLFGTTMLTVLTGSMAPALPQRTLILVRATPPEEIRPGDIITFYATIGGQEGMINTHRVVEVTQQDGAPAFVTRGDANPAADPTLVPGENLIGRVFFQNLILGVIISALRAPMVFPLLVLIPLLIIIFSSVRRLIRLAREEISIAADEPEEENTHGKR